MKIAISGDVHFSKTSSIITSNGTKFTTRLEHCIKSVNWVENTAVQNGCEAVIYLGDFFNTAEVDDETITAVSNISWSPLKKYFLVGNHDSSIDGLRYNAVKMLEGKDRIIVDNYPFSIIVNKTQIHFLPYISELDRQSLANYMQKNSICDKHVVCSHNDIAGLQLGPVMSTTGFKLDEILAGTDLYLNGHLHNGSWVVPNKLCNVGILTGQNFSEDAQSYSHKILILDTDTLTCTEYENPYAFNFYKLDINSEQDCTQLNLLKNNAVVSIKCQENMASVLRTKLQQYADKIIESRLMLATDYFTDGSNTVDLSDLSVDHLARFVQCCHENINNSEILEFELTEICK